MDSLNYKGFYHPTTMGEQQNSSPSPRTPYTGAVNNSQSEARVASAVQLHQRNTQHSEKVVEQKMGVIFSYTKNEQSDAESFIKALVFINKLRGNDFVGKDNIFNRLEKNWLKTEQTKKEFYLDFMLNAATSGQTNPQEHRDVIEALKAFDLVDSFM